MKNKELFDKTVSILVKAYQNDTLQHSNCKSCAVGNIVAANRGIELKRIGACVYTPDYFAHTQWFDFVRDGKAFKVTNYKQSRAVQEVKSTGYTLSQLAKIEYAFERKLGHDNDVDGFNGLMSVIDTLMLIHEATLQEAESAKLQFVKS